MALLTILQYPDIRLHSVAQPVAVVDNTIHCLINDMADTMYAAPGVGLAATQVNFQLRLVIVDISDSRDALMVFINPRIVASSGLADHEEGCLSVPGIFEKVKRAQCITVNALDRNGNPFQLEADGLLAVCIQHEIDHLEGRVFVEYLSRLKQQRIRAKFKKQQRR